MATISHTINSKSISPFILNAEQEHLFLRLTAFCNDISSEQAKKLIITGSAGTGKTSIIIYYIISSWLNTKSAATDIKYILCAPTNKAKDVMYNKYMEYITPILRNKCDIELKLNVCDIYPTLKRKLYNNVQFKTISQVLGINIQINNDGLQEFSKGDQTKIIQKYMNNPEFENTVIIVDEASMIDANCAAKLNFIPRPVIYLGDRCQLPPVNEESSIVFTYTPGPACEIVNLTKVERAQGSIITVSNHLRDKMLINPFLPNLIELLSTDQETQQLPPTFKNDVEAVALHRVSMHLTDGTICLYPAKPNLWLNTYLSRIIAQPALPDMGLTWTNSRCSILNNKMRQLIYNCELAQFASSSLNEKQMPPFLMKNEKIIIKDAFYLYGDKLYSSMVLYLIHISPELIYTPLSFMEWINCTYYSYLINASTSSITGTHNITYKPLNMDMLNSFKPITHSAAKPKHLTQPKGKTLADYGFIKDKKELSSVIESNNTLTPAEQLSKQLNTLRCTFIPDYPYYDITSTAEKGVIDIDRLAIRNSQKSSTVIDMYQLFMEAKKYSISEMLEFTNTGLPTDDFKEYHMFATRKLFGIPVEKVCCPLCEFLIPKLIPFIQEHDGDVYRLIQLTHGLELSCHNCKSKTSAPSKTHSNAFNLSLLTPAGQERYSSIEQEVRSILQNCTSKKIKLTKAEYVRFNTLLEQENRSLIGLTNNAPFINLSYVLGHYWSHCFADIFAKWDYGYFITIHKSQGSDYDNVFLDYFDLMSNTKQNERERLIYTGLTRAKSKCHIYCK